MDLAPPLAQASLLLKNLQQLQVPQVLALQVPTHKAQAPQKQAQLKVKKLWQNKRWVVDKPAWDETVVVKEAWDEAIYERKRFYKTSDGKVFDNVEDLIAYTNKVAVSTGVVLSDSSFYKKVLVKTEHHPAQTKVVHHPEQGHWE